MFLAQISSILPMFTNSMNIGRPRGFATFRPAQRGTIFYAEVKFDRMN
jgi:hypothetical protein